ncbi:MAG: SDR family oxidoreductase [candidate division Zixibacteria bacterium]|nr:SDR family oxidoreductase [candidate division Zixibacteria bacterium]
MNSLRDKIVLVTGASAGIGEACARKFSEAGARLLLCARRLDRLEKLAASLKTECYSFKLDIQKESEVQQAIASLPEKWQAVDILVNNAGLSQGLDKVQEAVLSDWNTMIDTNIKGLLYISRAIIPGMVERGRGHIINIGSIAGHEVYPGGSVYCATKHAVRALTKGMLIDLVETPVRVTSVDPGLVETEFSEVRFKGDRERSKTVYQGYKPLDGDDIAEACVWAASRPEHVNIAEILMLPKAQASCTIINKKP